MPHFLFVLLLLRLGPARVWYDSELRPTLSGQLGPTVSGEAICITGGTAVPLTPRRRGGAQHPSPWRLRTHGFMSFGFSMRLTSANLRVFLAFPMAALALVLRSLSGGPPRFVCCSVYPQVICTNESVRLSSCSKKWACMQQHCGEWLHSFQHRQLAAGGGGGSSSSHSSWTALCSASKDTMNSETSARDQAEAAYEVRENKRT